MAKAAIQNRTIDFREAKLDADKRTVELSFSSEEPVSRFDGRTEFQEILSHDPADVDLSRLGDGGHPLLLNHDPDRQIGVVETARVDADRKGRAVVRFSRSQFADDIWKDVQDGIRRKVSVRYQTLEQVRATKDKSGMDSRVFRWLPLEVSIVSIPADATVGGGRELNQPSETKDYKPMSEQVKPETPPKADSGALLEESVKVISQERERADNIQRIAKNIGHIVSQAGSRAEAAIAEGWTVERFQRHMLELMPSAQPVQRSAVAEVPQRDLAKYSILNVVRSLMERGQPEGLEREISDELARASGQKAAGAWLPYAVLAQSGRRDNLFVTGSLGGLISPVNLLASEYIDALRNRLMVVMMGARILPGLSGTVVLPKLLTPSALTVKTEGAAYATSTPLFGQVTLSPKIAPGLVRFSKLMAVQSSPAIEQLVRDDLTKMINTEIDRQALHGAGSGGEATGIAATTGIGHLGTVAAGAAPTYSRCVSLETEVAVDNADEGSLGYLTNPKVRGKLKETLKNTESSQFVWEFNPANPTGLAIVNGYKAAATNQVKSNLTTGTVTTAASAMFFGNWSELILGYFGGGIDLTADPYSVPGWIQIHGQQYFDVAVRHAESFAWDNNIITT